MGHGVIRVAREAWRCGHDQVGMCAGHHWFMQHSFGHMRLERVWRHCRHRGEHGFSASAFAAEAGTDSDEDGKAYEGTQKRDLPSQVVFINMALHRRPDDEDPDRQSALGIHLSTVSAL